MFYLGLLLTLTLLIAALFIAPLRSKIWVALTAVTGAIAALAYPAITALMTTQPIVLMQTSGPIFGAETLTIDSLSALLLLIIGIAGFATVIYSRGYMAQYLDKKSSAHISLHYAALVIMILAMMLVVVSSGGFSFLLAWELMTIASFILILFDAQRAEVLRAALAYLIMMHIGFIFLVAGFATLYATTGSASFDALPLAFGQGKTIFLFVLFLLGFGMKAGLYPKHTLLRHHTYRQ